MTYLPRFTNRYINFYTLPITGTLLSVNLLLIYLLVIVYKLFICIRYNKKTFKNVNLL